MSECCHYEEGYEDGLAAGGGEESAASDALAALARQYERCGDWRRAEFAREFAETLAHRSLKRLVEDERKREAELSALYRASVAA